MDIGMLGMWRLHAWRYWRLVAAVLMIQQWQWLADHSDLALMSAYFTWKIASCLAVHLCYLVRCLWFLYTCFWLIMLWSSTKNIVQFCEFLPHLFKLLAVVISEFYFWHSLCYVQKEWRVTDIAYLVHRFTMAVTSLINASRGNIQCHMTSFFILLYHFMVPLFLLLMV